MTIRRSQSLIEVGDEFVFNGLRGQMGDDNGIIRSEDLAFDKKITITDILADGRVRFQVTTTGGGLVRQVEDRLISYADANALIQDRIWQFAKDL